MGHLRPPLDPLGPWFRIKDQLVDPLGQFFFLFAFLTKRRMIIGADQNDQISGSRTLTWCPSCSPVNILPASAQRSINAEQPSAKTPIIVFRKRPDMGQAVTKFEDLGIVDFKGMPKYVHISSSIATIATTIIITLIPIISIRWPDLLRAGTNGSEWQATAPMLRPSPPVFCLHCCALLCFCFVLLWVFIHFSVLPALLWTAVFLFCAFVSFHMPQCFACTIVHCYVYLLYFFRFHILQCLPALLCTAVFLFCDFLIWGRSGVILECRITVCNYYVEPSIKNHNRVLGMFVSTRLLLGWSRNGLH